MAGADTALALTGHLTMLEIERQLPPVLAALRRQPVLMLDLAAVTAVDSAALSLLLEARRQAQTQGGSLRVRAVPDALRNLARLYGVDPLLQEMDA